MKPLADLEHHDCRWPVALDADGVHLFCAAPIAGAGRSYCADHVALAYVPDRPKAPKPDKKEAIRELQFAADVAGV